MSARKKSRAEKARRKQVLKRKRAKRVLRVNAPLRNAIGMANLAFDGWPA